MKYKAGHADKDVSRLAKKGMRRPDVTEPHGTESNKKLHLTKNEQGPVPEIQGHAKRTKEKAGPL